MKIWRDQFKRINPYAVAFMMRGDLTLQITFNKGCVDEDGRPCSHMTIVCQEWQDAIWDSYAFDAPSNFAVPVPPEIRAKLTDM